MAHAMEQVQEQDDVECADFLGRYVIHTYVDVLDVGAERSAGIFKAIFTARTTPCEAIRGNHPSGSESLGGEAEVTIAGADVKDGLAGEVGQAQGPQIGRGAIDPRSGIAAGQVDPRPPVDARA